MVITTMLRNLRETGSILMWRQWDLFTANIWELALSDLAMAGSTALSLPLHMLYFKTNIFRWNNLGMIVQSIFQAAWLLFWVE